MNTMNIHPPIEDEHIAFAVSLFDSWIERQPAQDPATLKVGDMCLMLQSSQYETHSDILLHLSPIAGIKHCDAGFHDMGSFKLPYDAYWAIEVDGVEFIISTDFAGDKWVTGCVDDDGHVTGRDATRGCFPGLVPPWTLPRTFTWSHK